MKWKSYFLLQQQGFISQCLCACSFLSHFELHNCDIRQPLNLLLGRKDLENKTIAFFPYNTAVVFRLVSYDLLFHRNKRKK